jgi:hypothetical protein
MTTEERKAYNRERNRKWRAKNPDHYRTYQREYKRQMRSKKLREV